MERKLGQTRARNLLPTFPKRRAPQEVRREQPHLPNEGQAGSGSCLSTVPPYSKCSKPSQRDPYGKQHSYKATRRGDAEKEPHYGKRDARKKKESENCLPFPRS